MYRLTIHDYFSSAHQLKGYKGECEGVHGHNWKVEVEVEGEGLSEIGLLVDFHELKTILKEVIGPLDHVMLNEVEGFRACNPSSELIARHVYREISGRLPDGVDVTGVTVWESENSRATYYE